MSEIKENIVSRAAPPVKKASYELKQELTWQDAFWFTSGVPALVLFSIGAVAATVGNLTWVVWMLSIVIGFTQSFVYAEIAGLYPGKSGGASVYGAMGWIKYSKFIAPISVWCNWLSWSPVLALGTKLAAGFILTTFFPSSAITAWGFTLLDLGFIRSGLLVRIDAAFMISVVLLLIVFGIQHRGALKAARFQKYVAIIALIPILIVGTIPLFMNGFNVENLTPTLPGGMSWGMAAVTLLMGGMFLASWSTYPFESAICYTNELKNPKKDTAKSLISAGILCVVVFTIVPLSFQNALGLKGLLDPAIADGTGVAKAMALMVGAGAVIGTILVVLLILSTLTSIMTSMAGSSRTLYQGSVDGWLPKYLSHVNHNGAPTSAMWTDLVFNLFLLLLTDYTFILALANVNYIIFVFLNLNAVWIHRLDRPNRHRPFKVPNWLLAITVVLSFVNIVILGMGADIWGPGTLWTGLITASFILPVFLFRHFVTDKGKFPEGMEVQDEDERNFKKKAGILPFISIGVAIILLIVSHQLAVYL